MCNRSSVLSSNACLNVKCIKNPTSNTMMKIRLFAAVVCTGIIMLPAVGCSRTANTPEELSPKDAASEKIYAEARTNHNPAEAEAIQNIGQSRQNAITEAVKVCSPAIVGINVTEVREYNPFGGMFNDPFFRSFTDRFSQKQEVKSLGSGFLISSDGYILTNDHVAGSAKKIVVTMTNGEKFDAEIIGTDPTSDVALLKIKGSNFPYLKLFNSDDVIVGEWAIAFGNPFGLFDINARPTITVGVVSNTGVSFTQDNRVYRNMIQTDAAISSGNSGGPLVNSLGEVIGMNTVIYSTAQSGAGAGSIGIGFAVPINRVKKVVDILKRSSTIDRNFDPGFLVQDLDERIARSYGLETSEGIVITQVKRRSSADKAGLEPGDVILNVDGAPIHKSEDLQVIISDGVTGQTFNLTVLRGDEKLTKKMTLEKAQTGR